MAKRYTSKYDSYFEKTAESAKCSLCSKIIKFSQTSGSNNLRFHLTKDHVDVWQKISSEEAVMKKRRESAALEEAKQGIIPFLPVSKKSFKLPVKQGENIEKELTKWDEDGVLARKVESSVLNMIVMDNLPMSFVENEGFKQFIQTVAPKLKLKKRKYFSESLFPKLLETVERKVSEELNSMKKLAVTTDAWSSKDGKHSLLSCTGHWIDKVNFVPKVAVLGSAVIKGRHTADNLLDILEKSYEKFGVKRDQVVCVVRDGAPNMESLCKKLKVNHFQCYAHNLQLVVKHSLAEVPEAKFLFEKFKKYVRKVNKSHVVRDIFQEIQKEEQVPERMLVKGCEVRWSSMFHMVRTFLENQRAVSLLKIDHPELDLPEISSIEWEKAQLIHEILKPLATTTARLQNRYGSIASVVIPSIRLLQFDFRKIKETTSDEIKIELIDTFLRNLKIETNTYTSDAFLKTATFLDCRFKDSYFLGVSQKDHVLQLMRESNQDVEESDGCSDENISHSPECYSVVDEFLKENSPEIVVTKKDRFEEEIDEYLKHRPVITTDPFVFWAQNQTYPCLKKLAMEYLCVPATSAESERLFSLSGLICTPKRSSMKSEMLDQLTFCSSNMKLLGIKGI